MRGLHCFQTSAVSKLVLDAHLHLVQFDNCTGPPYHKLDILTALANNHECQDFERGSQIRHQAAAYRRDLFAEMMRQGHPLQKRCVLCNENCNPHKPSPIKDGPKARLSIRGCLCLFHTSCLAQLEAKGKGCPNCRNFEKNSMEDMGAILLATMRHMR